MYYILNETNQIIAADDSLLELCGATHIDELSSGIVTHEVIFDLHSDDKLNIISLNGEETFEVSKISLSSLLGKLTLINISSNIAKEETSTIIEDESTNTIDSIINDANHTEEIEEENLTIDEITPDTLVNHNEDDHITFGDHLDIEDTLDDTIMSVKEEKVDEEIEEEQENSEENLAPIDLPNDDELFDLVLEDDTPTLIEEKDDAPTSDIPDTSDLDDVAIDFDLSDENDSAISLSEPQEEVSEIIIDSEEISQKIGISNDDYKNFLNDFIDTALSLEKDLQSSDTHTRDDAISTLSHLSNVLHLPFIADIVSNIKDTDTQREDIESLYSTLSRITTQKNDDSIDELTQNDSTEVEETPLELESEEDTSEAFELFDEPTPEPTVQESTTERNAPKGESFGTISLEEVKPKHFDFQLEEAANDLSLPVELIEEFVHDFIDQAHIETKKMLQAYEDGDLDTIQKIGHLLKGASSNLRINALSDTLYKIQFCEKSDDLEMYIKDYWAHFLSFETQINAISH